ncbi:MAG TPA: DNA replication and repair protein RecF [Candidatus Saccharimonadales bacterium]|nr:DNA replication and repair protein RecF [Candidatus Saccharimonadales bacterium]
MINDLELQNYRSYDHHRFPLHPSTTLVVGPNATGKTNLLESIFVLANTKSFRTSDRELIKHGQTFFRIEATTPEGKIGLGYEINPKTTKKIDYNSVKRPLAKHIGNLPTVLFEPFDLQLLSGPPSNRRRYIDGLLTQTDQEYLLALNQYQKILKQRNSLLEKFDIGAVKDQIFAWDLNLTTAAKLIVERRLDLLEYLNYSTPPLYASISGQTVSLNFQYLSSIKLTNNYGEAFLDALAQNLPRDLAAGFTTIGPHREDFGLSFDKSEVAAVASRGEIRSLILALKLAELELIAQMKDNPILLLDDVFSELDESRRKFLIKRLAGYQTIITTTDADLAKNIKLDHSLIEMSKIDRYAIN